MRRSDADTPCGKMNYSVPVHSFPRAPCMLLLRNEFTQLVVVEASLHHNRAPDSYLEPHGWHRDRGGHVPRELPGNSGFIQNQRWLRQERGVASIPAGLAKLWLHAAAEETMLLGGRYSPTSSIWAAIEEARRSNSNLQLT